MRRAVVCVLGVVLLVGLVGCSRGDDGLKASAVIPLAPGLGGDPTALSGRTWAPFELPGLASPVDASAWPDEPFLELRPDGTFTMDDGCEQFSGTYDAGPDGAFQADVRFSGGGSCIPVFGADLVTSAQTWAVVDSHLELVDYAGARVVLGEAL